MSMSKRLPIRGILVIGVPLLLLAVTVYLSWQADHRDRVRNRYGDIAIWLDRYANDHEGRLPNDLSELMPRYLSEPALLDDLHSGQRIVYVGAGKQWHDSHEDVIAHSPVSKHGGRWALFNDGSVRWLAEHELAEVLARAKR
jgi:hypothetical protein